MAPRVQTTWLEAGQLPRNLVHGALGRLVSAQSGASGRADYAYNGFEQTVTQRDSSTYGGEKQQTRTLRYDSLGRLVYAFNPESRATQYEYHPGGALKKRSDARGAWVAYEVDALDRFKRKSHGGTGVPVAEAYYCYDGRTLSASGGCELYSRTDYPGGALTGHYAFDAAGALVASTEHTAIDGLGQVQSSVHEVGGLGQGGASTATTRAER